VSSKSEATKARILDAARGLFNEHGTAPISTNRIAADAGISPGNLYYHYADKKEIIRALLAEMIAAYEVSAPGDAQRETLATLRARLARGSELAWHYRFFGREIVALLRSDPELARTYREVYRRRLNEWAAFAEQMVAQGLVRPPRSLSDLTTVIWLIAENWITFLDIAGDPDDPAQVARQADLVRAVLEPHLTAKARRLWTEDR
jgi:AcrR family transcriptional regulator